jgi:Na+-translocating ferredoxin:NAD+ oxidoreductase RNF subunit RnfB
MESYFYAVLVLGLLGFTFGGILSFASKKFHVEVNPLILQSQELLPGANCGSCGYPGCSGFAAALVEKGEAVTKCPVLSAGNRKKLAELLGQTAGADTEQKTALVRCNGLPGEEYQKFEYHGIPDCQAAILILNGPKLCPHRCIGLGSCVKACKFDAIVIGPNELPIIDPAKCTSCGKCVLACPKQLITLVPTAKAVHVKCNSHDKGADTRKVCKVGCIGCKMCQKVCAYDAIIIENNLARIDYEKCVECGACVAKCPQKSITLKGSNQVKPKKAVIDEPACIGCTLCFKVCKFQAIQGGTPKEKHSVVSAKCVGCGMCVQKCPKKCISLVEQG